MHNILINYLRVKRATPFADGLTVIALSLNATVVSLALPSTKLIGGVALICLVAPAFSIPDASRVPCSSRTSYQEVSVNLITNTPDGSSGVFGVSVAAGVADDVVDEVVVDADKADCVFVEVILGVFVNWYKAILSIVFSG